MSVASPKTAGLVTIRYVVMSVLNRTQDYSMRQYKRLVQLAIDGFSELSLYHINAGLEVVYLHMSAAKTIQLPADYVQWTKIGFPLNGKLRVITNNENILLPRTFYGNMVNGVLVPDTGEAVGNTDSDDLQGTSNALYFSDHFKAGQFIGGMYGLPGGIDTAYFRVDIENRQVVFSGETPRSEIVMEYQSSGLKIDGSSLIPRETVSALRTYVLWAMVENDQRVALNEKERRKGEHREAVEALRFFQNSFTKEEYLRMVYSTTHQTIKR